MEALTLGFGKSVNVGQGAMSSRGFLAVSFCGRMERWERACMLEKQEFHLLPSCNRHQSTLGSVPVHTVTLHILFPTRLNRMCGVVILTQCESGEEQDCSVQSGLSGGWESTPAV